jgi:fused signal recognition particle receptor
MEPLLIVLLAVLALVLIGGGAFLATKGRRSVPGVPVEPPLLDQAPGSRPATKVPTRPVEHVPVAADESTPAEIADRVSPEIVSEPIPATVEPPVEPPVDLAPVDLAPVEPPAPRFRDRLGKARGALGGYFGGVIGRSTIDQTTWDDLEEALIVADVGPLATTEVLDDLKSRVKSEAIKTPEALMDALRTDLKKRLAPGDRSLRFDPGVTNVWLFVGVNGVGKTTTIGKVAKQQMANGRTVLMAAGDTFRAAAAEQLTMWAERTGAEIVRGSEGADPASVIYTGVEKAAAKNIELVLADTAGRLQTKTNLMEELGKIRRVADKEPGRVTETLLVLDATTGQNGLSQAEQFRGAADITGVVLTKLDGTAKGGIAFAIQTKLGIPIKLVGLGEQMNDLVPFDPDEYVDALFAE